MNLTTTAKDLVVRKNKGRVGDVFVKPRFGKDGNVRLARADF
jgi:hypothetical protein